MTTLDFVIDFIRLNFFFSFGIYSVINSIFKKSLVKFDELAIQAVPFWGIVWFAITLIYIFLLKDIPSNYIILYFIFSTLLFIFTQFFRKRKVKHKLAIRLLLGVLFLFSYEYIDFIAIIISKGSIPDTWINFNQTPIQLTFLFISVLLIKIISFIAFVFTFKLAKNVLKI